MRATLLGLGEWSIGDDRHLRDQLRTRELYDLAAALLRIFVDDFTQLQQVNLHHVYLSNNFRVIDTGMRIPELSNSFEPSQKIFHGRRSQT
jgi:hypothetical protein